MKKTSEKERTQIKVCLAECGNALFSSSDTPNINEPWHIALLSNNEKLQKTLLFDKIEYWMRILEEEESKKKSDNNETSWELDTIESYFFTAYVIYLNNYIKGLEDSPTKSILIAKKYLLLSLGDLKEYSSSIFEDSDTQDFLSLENIKEETLHFIVASFEEILANIKKTDKEIKETPSLKAFIILNLLILKCYLDIPGNKDIKEELIRELTNPYVYKNNEYRILSEILDDIIFNRNHLEQIKK